MDIQQLEGFALAEDRAKALETMIPGTEEHYFHSCLVREQAGDYEGVRTLTAAWVKRHGETARVRELRNRLALLEYPTRRKDSLEHLRRQLSLDFRHQRAAEEAAVVHPSVLDPAVLARPAIQKAGLDRSHPSDLSGFTDSALPWLADLQLPAPRLRALLGRVELPDHPRMVELVLADLADPHSSGFGSLALHGRLFLSQLEALLAARPGLLESEAFVNAWLLRLQPGPDVDWQADPAEHREFLQRLAGFVDRLGPKFDPLRAHILYHRLELDRRQGVYDRDRFLAYLQLPRQVPYANVEWLKRATGPSRPFGLGGNYQAQTLHPVVTRDEDLVRDYLAHLLAGAEDAKAFEPWLQRSFLDEVLATTRILEGTGDMEKWYSLLNDPGRYQALKDRVEISFALTNPAWFRTADPVELEVDVKNVPTLVIRVFEINTLNYCLAQNREVDTSIDLDGLVATEERTERYDDPPSRRVRRKLAFPGLTRPGVFVVELIGGGISSRALIRKGRLRFLERVSSAGHVFRILDEERRPAPGATLWMGGREYVPDDDGAIRLPFSSSPGRRPILLCHGGLATLEHFEHLAESYSFSAGIHVDRESLVKGREAAVMIRPSLRLHGAPASLELLEETTLVLRSVDREGVASSSEVRGLELSDDRETVHRFQVPDGLASLQVEVRAKVKSLSDGRTVDLEASRYYELNGIDTTSAIEDLHLVRSAEGYEVHLLGKTGEPRAGVVLAVNLAHRDLVAELAVSLQTDAAGVIRLGPLAGCRSLAVSTPAGHRKDFALRPDRIHRTAGLHARAGETVRIPWLGDDALDALPRTGRPTHAEASLVSLASGSGDAFRASHREAMSFRDGYLEIAGLPPGDYALSLVAEDQVLGLRVVPGEERDGWLAGARRQVERGPAGQLQLVAATRTPAGLELQLGGAGPRTRVHVLATRFVPEHSAYAELALPDWSLPKVVIHSRQVSHYVSGRDIGDEYRYIIDRKFARKFAGTMLPRPGLLLNPWAVRSTQTETQTASTGGAYAPAPPPAGAMPMCQSELAEPGEGSRGPFANLDFLADPPGLLFNLRPDGAGKVLVPADALVHANQVRIVVADRLSTVVRDVPLLAVRKAHADRRLLLALDASRHFIEQKQVSALEPGATLEIADITTSKVEVYDSLGRVFRLFSSLLEDAKLQAFAFTMRWPSLPEAEKRARYSELACHELSFFLSRKDPDFFERVVRPHLRNKRAKTFLDRYLLGDDLSAWLEPWAFGRLNIVERILLGTRTGPDPIARHVTDRGDLLPRDPDLANRLFQSAIQGRALEAGDALGMGRASEEAKGARLSLLTQAGGGMGADAFMALSMAGPPGAPMPPGRAPSRPPAASAPSPKLRAKRAEAPREEKCEESDEPMPTMADEAMFGEAERDLERRTKMPQLYQRLDKTQEWAENDYHHLTVAQQGPELVTVNPFWVDFARHREGAFTSRNVAYASRNFTECMLALAVLDLPFEGPPPATAFEGARMKLSTGGRALVFHKEIKEAEPDPKRTPVLVTQNYFRDDDRTRFEGGEEVEKYAGDELLANVVYACQVVLTNPTSATQKLELLLQIPQGAIPVRGGFLTRSRPLDLSPYATESLEYAFYFPAPGRFTHFPVHVSRNDRLVAFAPPVHLTVVKEPSRVDKSSWAWVAQHGSSADVLAWLEQGNIDRVEDLGSIAWRMRERAFYDACLALLRRRKVYHDVLWSYSVFHDDAPNIGEFLLHREAFLDQCGPHLTSALVTIDPVRRGRYQHLEYAPLVNARVQKLGPRRRILNDRLAEQYGRFLDTLRYRKVPSDDDRMALAYYLLVQDRTEEAMAALAKVDPSRIESRLQHAYFEVHTAFSRGDLEAARRLAEAWKDAPVDRWRNLFRLALAQLDELAGAAPSLVDEKDRDQRQAKQAAAEPAFELAVEKRTVTIEYRNLTSVRIGYYLMDIELLFSRQPFVQQQSNQFAFIRPNRTTELALPADRTSLSFELPPELHGTNVVVEAVAAGKRKSQACYAHALSTRLLEGVGHLEVREAGAGKPLPGTYFKVYGRTRSGQVRFYKDGYTDLRGMADYASLSTDELGSIDRFSILVLSEKHGAVIKEAAPPRT